MDWPPLGQLLLQTACWNWLCHVGSRQSSSFFQCFYSVSFPVVLKLLEKRFDAPGFWKIVFMHTDAGVHKEGTLDTFFSCNDDFISGVNWRII